jgi:peptidoglycan/LPS O-acetylase OafA/YrhL
MDLKPFIPYLAIGLAVLLLARRTRSARRVRGGAIFLVLGLLLLAVGFYVYGHVMIGPHVSGWGGVAIVAALLAGIGCGIYAARHIHLFRDPETGHPMSRLTVTGLLFIVGLIVVKQGARHLGLESPDEHGFGLLSDSLFALAMGTVFTRQILLLRRARALPPHGATA